MLNLCCASFRDSLYTDCRLFNEQVGALFSMFMSISFSLIFVWFSSLLF